MENFNQRIASLPPEKRAILEAILKEKSGQIAEEPPIGRRENREVAPLSFAQQRLWFLDQLEPGNSAYNMPVALRLKGQLNVAAMVDSLSEVVRRHESLRTTIMLVEDEPMQVIAPPGPFPLAITDLKGLPESERVPEAKRLAEEEAQRSFDLMRGPLVRASLLQMGEEDHALLLTMHHIISDGWSLRLMVKEIAALYEAFSAARPSPLHELPIQYGDYAHWQRQWLQGKVLERQLAYWKRHFAGAPAMLELPLDRPRPAVQSYRGGRHNRLHSEDLSAALRNLSKNENATLFMTLLAVFQTLLHLYTGQTKIVVGTPIAGRNRADIESVIGFFVNSLALNTDFAGAPTFREVLEQVRDSTLSAYNHQDLPFEKVLEVVQPERSLGHTPLFQTFFNMDNLSEEYVDLPGLTIEYLVTADVGSKFDLTLYVVDYGRQISLQAVYNTDLFEHDRIVELLDQFEYLVAQIVADPDVKISQLSLVTPSARLRLPDPAVALDGRWVGSVQAHFTGVARRMPHRVAVSDKDEAWTYEELDRRSNQLAHYLHAKEIHSGDLVAIYAHRSASLVWALLSVLKAGAAFLILDPRLPVSRLQECLRLAKPRGWLQIAEAGPLPVALDEFVATLANRCSLELPRRSVAAEEDFLGDYSTEEVDLISGPDDLAYVAFTSGTTGQPKGVLGRHGSLTHFLPWFREEFGLDDSARFSMLSGLAHDPLHRDIFMPLQTGAQICIPDPEKIGMPGWLERWMQEQQISVANLTPSLGRLLSENACGPIESRGCPALRSLFFVGEALTRQDVSLLSRLAPNARCINFYGTTETQQALSYFIVPRAGGVGQQSELDAQRIWEKEIVPLGRGIKDVQLLVLNEAMQQAGIGEAGEIYVRSPHLAHGYLSDSSLTNERFIRNPFRRDAGDRLYRTGDLGRYLPDGNVEPLGRRDKQVKIRGFRVELGEIESVLTQHPEVLETVVLARETTPGEQAVAAYFVPRQEFAPSAVELISFLRQQLPDYMLPSAFVKLEAMPLTPNGKTDRQALLCLEQTGNSFAGDYVGPRTSTEEILTQIWLEVLDVERVSVLDNFFALGGHSLLATQIVARVRDAFQVELPLRSLFEFPTVVTLSDKIEQLKNNERLAELPPIVPVSRENVPLSFAQQRLWFLDQLEPESAFYNVPAAVRMSGPLNVRALEETLTEIVRRHEALRTVFPIKDGQPVQQILAAEPVQLEVTELSALAAAEREREARRLATAEGQRPFNLATGPLLRASVLRLAAEEHVVLLTLHHIISDGWSLGVLVQEVATLYAAYSAGEVSPLPELTIQYADYAHWQREWLQGEVLAEQLAYWREQLAGAPAVLELPADKPRPVVQSYQGAAEPVLLSAELTAALQELSRREGVTLFMTLLAAFQTLLYRYTGERDIVVGSPIANRHRVETEGLIGFFVNTLVLRARMDQGQSFRELLRQVREVTLGAYAHQDVPFDRLVEELQPERSLSRQPLFQVMFILQNAPQSELKLPGLELQAQGRSEQATTKFDLNLTLSEQGGKVVGSLEYNRDLFAAENMTRLMRHFERLLESVVTEPGQRLGELKMIEASERETVLRAWNETGLEYPREQCVHELFEAQVERTPEAVALVSGEVELNYRELNRRANQLAHYLQQLGVGPESLVGICVERSVEMVVSLLAVLKAGAAYLPLDPDYPQERVAFMLADAQVGVLLTQGRLRETLPASEAVVVSLEEEGEQLALQPDGNPVSTVKAGNLAYVIYTSGSTGQPKGILITHGSVVNLLYSMLGRPGLAASDNLLAVTTIAFDISVLELLLPLIAGARVIVLPREEAVDAFALQSALARHEVSIMQATPATWRMLIESGWEGDSALTVLSGGEALSRELASHLRARTGRVWNMYGPTETTIWSTCWEVKGSETILIGRGVGNTQLYLLDSEYRPVVLGAVGELYIGGVGLARGYRGRAGLTAERFVPDPFSLEGGRRLYRTGDLARWTSEGELACVGRADNQVKVRGFRIELGEVESALRRDERVREAVVVARADKSEEQRLIGYVVVAEGEAVSGAELRAALRQQLPEYMVPTALVVLERLPLTPNGKVDRRALPEPEAGGVSGEYVAARTPVEELLASIWTAVLGAERVGVTENFFELGGHSLLATQVMTRIRKAFGVEITLHALFELPTIAALAESIETKIREGQDSQLPPLTPGNRADKLPLSFTQQRFWFLDQLEPGNPAYNMPAAVRLEGQLNIAALEQSLTEVVRRHEALRTSFTVVDGQPVQVIMPPEPMALPLFDVSELPESERELEAQRLATSEAQFQFDLAAGPLLRASLIRIGEEDHVALLNMHHIISDGWSRGVLIREIASLYSAFIANEPSSLSELPIQYADYAQWQREWLQGEALEKQLAYWRQQLAGMPPVLNLVTDRPRPAVQRFRGASQQIQISAQVKKALQSLSRKEGVTLFMTLLAAFDVLLHRYTGQENIAVGTPIAGRNHIDLEKLIGVFVNTLVLRSRLAGEMTFSELLRQVREVTLGAYAHQDVPFEKLVEELQPERDLSYSPLFQVMFVMLEASHGRMELPNLTLSPMDNGRNTVRFDLLLHLVELDEQLYGNLEYNRDLFDAESITRMIRHFERLLESIAADPQQRLNQLEMFDETERHTMLVKWNDAITEYPREQCVHQLFESQVERTPDAVALVFQEEELSYRELNRRANQLAHHLQSLGVGPESLVGICVERSVEMVLAVLAVLKAGGAYLPLDPDYPAERLAFMVNDTAASILLTQRHLISRLPAHVARVICLDAEGELLATESPGNLETEVGPDNLVYVIYTSGSTGQPKGILITHGSVVSFLHSMLDRPGLSASDSVLGIATLSFDISVLELLLPLIAGARVIVLPREEAVDAFALQSALARHEVSIMQATPATWRMLIESGWEGDSALTVLSGGEALSRELASQLRARTGRVWNVYGPTETTVWATCWEVKESETILIGRGVGNTQLYLLDSEYRPVVLGAVGELYIGGVGLARGYRGRAGLTAERFVPDPFSLEGGRRLYRTGDLARWTSDGELACVGRADNQVKVRGFRIELGEVESALRRDERVREAVVVARADKSEEQRLIGYVVVAEGEAVSGAELRAALRQQLPEYMVPTALVVLERLPLTPNGKVDRRALPEPEAGGVSGEYVAARTPVEELLASIWTAVLGAERVGVTENFFELGGHSLLATQVMSRVREVLKMELPLRTLFEAPTVESLAAEIEAASGREQENAAPTILPVTRDQDLPLSFAQQRLWFLDQLQPSNAFYNVGSAVRMKGQLNVGALAQTLTEIVRRHEALRTVFRIKDDQPFQFIMPAAAVTLPITDLSVLPDDEREAEARRLATAEAQRPFDLAHGPLLRASLLKLSEAEHLVLFTMHHIVSDGWSEGVLANEVATLYQAFNNNEPSPLSELPIQYADYAYWQRKWLQGDVLERQLAYWRQQLEGSPDLLELPIDRPRPLVQTFRGANYSFDLPLELAQDVKALSRREGVTLFMTLLAAYQTLLYHYSGQQDIVVGAPIANRNRGETERLIGFFANTLALRSRIDSAMSFRALLQQVREVTLAGYAHQDVPFDRLVEELQPERNLSHTPLFQVTLTLNNAPAKMFELPELSLSPVWNERGRAPFDLVMSMRDTEFGLLGTLGYSTDLFDATTVSHLVQLFRLLLQRIVATPEASLGRLSAELVAADKEQKILEEQQLAQASLSKLRNARRQPVREHQ